MGSDSDLPVMAETTKVLDAFGIGYEVKIISAHRSPALAHEYATTAEACGLALIIAGAGKAVHLAGVMASLTPLPIIGVPIETSLFGGLDSLLSTVQMPSGVPVAIGKSGAKNAGILAAQIIAVTNTDMRANVKAYK